MATRKALQFCGEESSETYRLFCDFFMPYSDLEHYPHDGVEDHKKGRI